MKPLTNAIIQSVSNLQLVSAMRLIQSVEQPPYIPVYEVVTLDQAVSYFGTQLGVLHNLYNRNRMLMQNFTYKLCAADVEPYALEVDDFGKTYSFKKFLFVNGVSTTLSYSKQLVFDARALLMFAILIKQYKGEIGNGNAEKIYDLLHDSAYKTMRNMPVLKPWYCYEPKEYEAEQNEEERIIASPHLARVTNVVRKEIDGINIDVKVEEIGDKINVVISRK